MYYGTVSKKDLKRLNQAIKIAERSNCRMRHGALILKGNRVLAMFPNRMRNHPNIVSDPHSNSSFHAEARAIRQLEDAAGTTVYVARVGASGPTMSKPCENCEKLLREAKVRRVVYTTFTGIGVDEY